MPFLEAIVTEAAVQNYSKVAYNAMQTLNDPCHRFTYGITIEDCDARLWFFNRGQVIVSQPFDWLTVSLPSSVRSRLLTL
jgi:hypothetical protein